MIFYNRIARHIAAFCLCSILAIGSVAGETVRLDRGDFGDFKRSLNHTDYGYMQVPDPTGGAPVPITERFEVRPGDCDSNSGWNDCTNDRERSELSQRTRRATPGTMAWYGWSIYLPKDYVNVFPTKVALGQFHQQDAHVIWMFQNADGGYYLDDQVPGKTRRYYPLIAKGEMRGRWHRIEVQVNWQTDATGYFRVWVDGVQKVDYAGPTMTARKVYFKYGLYRSFLSRYKTKNHTDQVPAQTVYYANVKRAVTRNGLLPDTP